MKRTTVQLVAVTLVIGCPILAKQGWGKDGQDEPVHFTAIDVYVDSVDQRLAAYQFELAAEIGQITIVGVEGGQHQAFAEPPYYDPEALNNKRIIIADFNTGDDLPVGRTRVARIHLRVTGNQPPEYVVKLDVAASPEGHPIEATATIASPGENE